jgi:nucleotide-binding universal stress UspA family protein
MFEKVLVALDFSVHSRHILERVREIPGTREVVLLHVVDATHPSRRGWIHGPEIENARILMTESREYLGRTAGEIPLHVEVIVETITQGDVPGTILETAASLHAGLVLLGRRGMNPIQELLLGSVSSSVLRHAKTHLLILPSDTMTGSAPGSPQGPPGTLFSRVLVPTDFSLPAAKVVSLLRNIPGIKGMVLVHVVHHADTQSEIHDRVVEAESRLASVSEDLRSTGKDVKFHIRVGDPTEMILSVAEEEDVSLIAMHAHGTDRLREMFIGSTTFTVVRRARRPVLVLRTGDGTTRPGIPEG